MPGRNIPSIVDERKNEKTNQPNNRQMNEYGAVVE
jgi:hypothetical protein